MEQIKTFLPFVCANCKIPVMFHTIPGYYYDGHIAKFCEMFDYVFAPLWCSDLTHGITVKADKKICFLVKGSYFSPKNVYYLEKLVLERRIRGYSLRDDDVIFIHISDVSQRYITLRYPASLISHTALFPMFRHKEYYTPINWNNYPKINWNIYSMYEPIEQSIAYSFGQELMNKSTDELRYITAIFLDEDAKNRLSLNVVNLVNAARYFYHPYPNPTSLSNMAKVIAAFRTVFSLNMAHVSLIATPFIGASAADCYIEFWQEKNNCDPIQMLQTYDFNTYNPVEYMHILHSAIERLSALHNEHLCRNVLDSLYALFPFDSLMSVYGMSVLSRLSWTKSVLSNYKLTKDMMNFLKQYQEKAPEQIMAEINVNTKMDSDSVVVNKKPKKNIRVRKIL